MKKILVITISLLATAGIFITSNTDSVSASTNNVAIVQDEESDVSETEYLANIQSIPQVTGKQLIDLINSDSNYILYIGYKGCPHCRTFSRVLKQYIPLSPKPIYYVNLEAGFPDITESEFPTIQNFMTAANVQFTPTVLDVENKEIINEFVGDSVTLNDLMNIK